MEGKLQNAFSGSIAEHIDITVGCNNIGGGMPLQYLVNLRTVFLGY
jgi:hypothetical protein